MSRPRTKIADPHAETLEERSAVSYRSMRGSLDGSARRHRKTPRRARRFRDIASRGAHQTTAPSLKIGRYMAMTRPPTSTPRIAMISGSSKLLIASTAASTSAS